MIRLRPYTAPVKNALKLVRSRTSEYCCFEQLLKGVLPQQQCNHGDEQEDRQRKDIPVAQQIDEAGLLAGGLIDLARVVLWIA